MSIESQFKDIGKQLGKIVDEGGDFFAKAHPEVTHKRLTVCYNCDDLIDTSKRCQDCGCFVHKKTPLESQYCPKGKW